MAIRHDVCVVSSSVPLFQRRVPVLVDDAKRSLSLSRMLSPSMACNPIQSNSRFGCPPNFETAAEEKRKQEEAAKPDDKEVRTGGAVVVAERGEGGEGGSTTPST